MRHHYSLVSYLDSKLARKVRGLQLNLAEIANTHIALNTWEPHINVGAGIITNNEDQIRLFAKFQAVARKLRPFQVVISGFNCIGIDAQNRYIIQLGVQKNAALTNLMEILKAEVTNHYDRWYDEPWTYFPHVTLSFRDLSKENFAKAKAWAKEQSFHEEFILSSVSLAESNTNGMNGVWQEKKRFDIG